MARITKKLVDAIEPQDREVVVWDSELRGFGVRAHPSGVRTYVARYRTRDGRVRQVTLGRHGPLTPDAARRLAVQHLGEAAAGRDPLAERRAAREAARATSTTPTTLAEVAEAWLVHQRARKRPLRARTLSEYERQLTRDILPRLGTRQLADLTPADAQRLHDEMAERPTLANRCLDLLSTVWRWAESSGYASGPNPCRRVERNPEQRRARHLSHDELRRLGAALREMESRRGRKLVMPARIGALIRLLAFTGCRPGEIKSLRWEDVDLPRNVLRLRDAKTGDRDVWMPDAAWSVLNELPRRDGDAYVFPSKRRTREREARPLGEFRKPWKALLEAAEIEHVEPYVLRHTFATESEALGHSPYLTAALLGHSSGRRDMTRGYVHHIPDDVRRASERIARRIAAALDGTTPDNVVAIRA